MALRQHTKECLRFGLANIAAGSDYAAIIDAGTGTPARASKDALANAVGNRDIGKGLDTKVGANTPLADAAADHWRLAVACGSYTAALDIENEQAT